MHRLVSARSLLITTVCVVGVSMVAPSAQAVQWVDTASTVDEANLTLSQFGLSVDRGIAEHFDLAINRSIDSVVPQVNSGTDAQPVPATESAPLPNYDVRTDLQSQILAATPGDVVHRAPGSWFNAPTVPEASKEAEAEGLSLYGPGTPIYLGHNSMCTLAVAGTDAQGRKIGITAGHCGKVGDTVRSADSYWVGDSGTVVSTGTTSDYSLIELGSNATISNSYNGVTVDAVGGQVSSGEHLCKNGVATGYTCGLVWTADQRTTMSQVCATQGDSGAPLLAGTRLVGIMSGGIIPNYDLACKTPLQGPFFMPSLSTNMDQVLIEMDSKDGPGTGFSTLPR